MNLYHGSINNSSKHEFKHFGSVMTSIQRLDGMFLAQGEIHFDGGPKCVIKPINGGELIVRTLEENLKAFCILANDFVIQKHEVNINNPLRVNDEWGDDPIGSGGFSIIVQDERSSKELIELKTIFQPFLEPAMPGFILSKYLPKQINSIKKELYKNVIFKAELQKRKKKAAAIGVDFKDVLSEEIVWLMLTHNLRNWCLENRYDALVYKNIKEGTGEDCYVTLSSKQVGAPREEMTFDSQKYMDTILPIYQEFIRSSITKHVYAKGNHNNTIQRVAGSMWSGQDPLSFWVTSKCS